MQRLTITGTIDGVNSIFTVSPAVSVLKLWRGQVLQAPDIDYSFDGVTVTFIRSSIPQPGDVLVAAGEV